MQPEDQMYRLTALRYLARIEKKKKIASYLLDQQEQDVKLPLAEAIALKRDASKMDDAYKPRKVEKYWSQFWEHGKFYHANNLTTNPKRFVICLPPPNVTGYLHIGHALTTAIEDSLVRWKRMSGYQTLYVPGTDHAGIATQSVVQKKIMKDEGKTRHDFTREQFLARVWQWKEKHGNQILEQLRRTGSSLDWSRTVFTMDETLSKAVKQAFVRLYEKGLIYRANRLVNWSSILKTAISDIEVNYEDIQKRTYLEVPGYTEKIEFGVLIFFAYKLKEDPTKQIIVATTRIQTMLGDTAVAVHPDDAKYKDLIGKELIHPFVPERKIKIISDTYVDKEFGSGAVKITPAHDPNDYVLGERHKLEFINIFTDDGLINQNGGMFKGMKRFHCRKALEDQLKKLGLWKEKKDNKMRLALCQRSKDVVEPMIRPQWWVNCSEISKPMLQMVKSKELEILPSEYEHNWNRWIGDLKDWCISRQLWWGHRIPAYLVSKKGEPSKQQQWVVGRDDKQALDNAVKLLNLPADQIQIKQDEDVLDTWFSSGLFPFSVLKWPDVENPDFKTFFPNSILQTGHDILFFWVARMVMMSLWLTGKLPFKTVFLHPIVCDKYGEKMSKSKGNVIDPLEVIEGTSLQSILNKLKDGNLPEKDLAKGIKSKTEEFPNGIAECGSDALRFGLLAYMIQSRNINLDVARIEGYRQFCNKIWNTFKFGYSKFASTLNYDQKAIHPAKAHFLNSWILSKLDKAITGVVSNYQKYMFGQATTCFYSFWYYSLCDIYLEGTKPIFNGTDEALKAQTSHVLFQCVETGLRLLHPMMPFLTEELYQKLPSWKDKKESISIHSYPINLSALHADPKLQEYFAKVEKDFEFIDGIAKTIRAVTASVNLPPSIKPKAFILTENPLVSKYSDLVATLGKSSEVKVVKSEAEVPKGCGSMNCETNLIYVQLGEYINFDQESKKYQKKLDQIQGFMDNIRKKTEVKDYQQKASQKAKKENSQKLEKLAKEYQVVKDSLQKLNKLR